MNKEEKEAIEYLKKYIEWETCGERSLETDIETVLNLIQKQEKIIDKMAEYINELDIDEDICTKNVINPQLCNEEYSNCKECIKEYFKKEVEKDVKD